VAIVALHVLDIHGALFIGMDARDAQAEQVLQEGSQVAVAVHYPGESNLFLQAAVTRHDQIAKDLRREEGLGLEGHIIGGGIDVKAELAHALGHDDRPVGIEVQNLLDKGAVLVESHTKSLGAHAQPGGEDARAGGKPEGAVALVLSELLSLSIVGVLVRIGQAQEGHFGAGANHPLAVEQAAIEAGHFVCVDGSAEAIGEVVEREKVGQGDRFLQRIGKGLQVGGLADGLAPAHQPLGQGAVDGQLAVGNAVGLLTAQGREHAFARCHRHRPSS